MAPTDPWAIASKPKANFVAETQRINLPNTDVIQVWPIDSLSRNVN
jgi:hypothetical protein